MNPTGEPLHVQSRFLDPEHSFSHASLMVGSEADTSTMSRDSKNSFNTAVCFIFVLTFSRVSASCVRISKVTPLESLLPLLFMVTASISTSNKSAIVCLSWDSSTVELNVSVCSMAKTLESSNLLISHSVPSYAGVQMHMLSTHVAPFSH